MKYLFKEIDMYQHGTTVSHLTPKDILQYAVGALLYTPASYPKIVDTLLENTYPDLKSWAFCLEDSLTDQAAEQAADSLIHSLHQLAQSIQNGACPAERVPLIFIRVRSAVIAIHRFRELFGNEDYVYVAVRPGGDVFERSNMLDYTAALRRVNHLSSHVLYLMPILESQAIIYKESRMAELCF